MRISIFGIGYVGTVSAVCLADAGHQIVAVDIDAAKVDAINAGRALFHEAALPTLLSRMVAEKRLRSTRRAIEAIAHSEISLICVGTPSKADGSIDYAHLENVSAQIGAALREKTESHIIVFRSTMLPGTIRSRLIPILESHSDKRHGVEFHVVCNPEFLREGTAIADYEAPTQIVVGADNAQIAERTMSLYDGIKAPRTVCSLEEAEAVKYVSNIWRAHKISFANEMGNMLNAWQVNPHRVMDIFFQDTKINMGTGFLQPGFAFGGSCLPKDLRAVQAYAREHGMKTPLLNAVQEINETRVQLALTKINQLSACNVVQLGLSFKPGTDDIRESPYLSLAQKIVKSGTSLQIHDTNSMAPQGLTALMRTKEDICFENSDLIVMSHAVQEYVTLVNTAPAHIPVLMLSPSQHIFEGERKVIGLSW